MIEKLQNMMKGKAFWIALILLGIALEGVAAFYQYVMNEPPCILCIHFRLLVLLLIIVPLFGLLLRTSKIGRIILSSTLLLVFIGMFERSYQLLGTERGFIKGECAAALNFPDWIAVDKWIPAFFEPWTSCSYTPKIFLDITMAEVLIVFSVVMCLMAVIMLTTSILGEKYRK